MRSMKAPRSMGRNRPERSRSAAITCETWAPVASPTKSVTAIGIGLARAPSTVTCCKPRVCAHDTGAIRTVINATPIAMRRRPIVDRIMSRYSPLFLVFRPTSAQSARIELEHEALELLVFLLRIRQRLAARVEHGALARFGER